MEALSPAVVPTIPFVVGEKAIEVPVATPNVGVTNVGEFAYTTFPVPVLVFTPLPPPMTGNGLIPIAVDVVMLR